MVPYLLMQSAMTGAVGLKTTILRLQRRPYISIVHRNLRSKESHASRQAGSDYAQRMQSQWVQKKSHVFLFGEGCFYGASACSDLQDLFFWLGISFVASLVLAFGSCKFPSASSH
uniref:Uncharacterized protein n=1 Tax=Arundo donax TaxID=35708 RepID=A0A0A9AUN7_ARUDO